MKGPKTYQKGLGTLGKFESPIVNWKYFILVKDTGNKHTTDCWTSQSLHLLENTYIADY